MNHGIMIQRLVPRIRKLAVNLGLNPDVLEAMSERFVYQCAICLEPFVQPHVYFWTPPEGSPIARGVICSLCDSAIKRCNNEWPRLRKHKRFRWDVLRLRERLARLTNLDAYPGPFDPAPVSGGAAPAPSSSGTGP